MDKQGVKYCCERIIAAVNGITVTGESNMTNLLAVCKLARLISTEMDKPDADLASGNTDATSGKEAVTNGE